MTITASFADEHGNPLALGSKVYWHLQGSGAILQCDTETVEGAEGASVASAVLRAGSIPGLVQKVVIETDLVRKEVLVPNTPLELGLAAAPQWITVDGQTTCTVALTANVNAPDGTPIRWASTRGQYTSAAATVSNGQAQATVQINATESNYGLAVFTAAVAQSLAKASIQLQRGGAHFSESQLQSPDPTGSPGALPTQATLQMNFPQWAGQSVRISPQAILAIEDQQPTGATLLFADGSTAPVEVALDAQGKAQVVVEAPEMLTASGTGGVRIEYLESSGEIDPGTPPLDVQLPVQVVVDAAWALTGAGAVAEAGRRLAATVSPSNGALTTEEMAEIERAFQEAFRDSQSTGFVSGLLELFPLEGGGDLQNQAAHANWRLRLAEFLEGQTAAIREAAAEAEKIRVENGEGLQIVLDTNNGQMQVDNGNGLLMEVDFGAAVMQAIRETSGNAGWVTGLEKTIDYAKSLLALRARAAKKFESFIQSHGSTPLFDTCRELVKRLGPKVISDSDFDDAVEFFMPEGTARLLRALEEFSRTANGESTAFAGLVFEDVGNNLLKPSLNGWANGMENGGAKFAAGVTVSTVGFYYQLFTTVGSLATMAGDATMGNTGKIIKRAAGHLVGLAISAALGSEEARTQLGKMCPGYSWYLIGLEQMQQWQDGDFFEAGRTAFDFELNAVGDLTIAIPLAKGTAALLRLSGQARKGLIQALARRAAQKVARETLTPPVRALPKKPPMPPPVQQARFNGVTYPRHLNGLYGETKFSHYLHYQTEEIVIRWGDGVGTHGADIITVNAKTGRVTLWDTKWRTNPTMIGPSKTFTEPARLQNAVSQAEGALNQATYLPPALRQKALDDLGNGIFNAHTPGVGPGAMSSGISHN